MSFAERQRAEAEAAFQKIAPNWKPKGNRPPPPPALDPPIHKSEFQLRISEQDTLTTELRIEGGKRALKAAHTLAERFRLPPDQNLLMKVMTLGDNKLTKLAIEELLELEDRGRVRANPELITSLRGLKSRDKEIRELRDLFLEKLGAPKAVGHRQG
ncbi:MAG: hypothetical protein ACFB9M_08390 [Myxococcota bacterium]